MHLVSIINQINTIEALNFIQVEDTILQQIYTGLQYVQQQTVL